MRIFSRAAEKIFGRFRVVFTQSTLYLIPKILHTVNMTLPVLNSDFKCNTQVPEVGTDSRIKHLAFRSQVFFLAGGSTHLEPCVSPYC